MSWEKKKLGDLCSITKGKIGISKAISGEYPLVVTSEARKSHNEFHFEGAAVIIPLVSSTGHGHRSLKRIHYQTGKFAVGSILCAVIPNDDRILNAEFLYRFLDLNREKELVSRMRGMANVTLPMKEIANIEVPLPPLEEQIKFVVEYKELETANNTLSDEITNQLDLVRQLRQSFLREAMQGKLVEQSRKHSGPNDEPATKLLAKIKAEKEQLIKEKKIKKQKTLPPISEDEIPFEIPENWVWCRLGETVNIKSGKRIHASDYRKEGIPFLRSGEIGTLGRGEEIRNQLFISNEKYFDVKNKFGIPKQGDILIACIGGSIGNTWVVDTRQFYYKDGNLVLIETIPQIDTTFLLSYLKSPFFWKNTILNATDSSYNA
ncbi:MAG: hypothetical protein DRJ01_15260, partial [Bacteroidetes bacterium]